MAVVKADAYGHGDVAVARALPGRRRDLARRRARGGRARPAGARHRGARSWCSRSSPPGSEAEALAADADAGPLHGRRIGAARRMPPAPRHRRSGAREGRHRDAPRGRLATRRRGRFRRSRGRRGVRPRGAVDPPREGRGRCCHHQGRSSTSFADVVDAVRAAGHDPSLLHAANTAGTILHPDARFDLVRVGIGIYGIEPAPGVGAIPRAAAGADVALGGHDGQAAACGRTPELRSPLRPARATRGWRPCRWGMRTGTLERCRRAPTS